VDDFISALASAMCDWQFRCCSLPEIDVIGNSSYVTPSDCVPETELGLETTLGPARAAAAAGRVILDPARAAACVDAFAHGSCSSQTMPQDPWLRYYGCVDPFVGRVPSGGACGVRDECVPGSRCVAGGQLTDNDFDETPEGLTAFPTIRTATSVAGACLPFVAEGEPCRVTGDCAPGLYCRGDTFVCAQPANEGEPCQAIGFREPPVLPRPCDDATQALVCAGGTCGRPPLAGDPCLSPDGRRPSCDPDPSLQLVCVGASFNGDGICEPAGKPGDPCGSDGLPTCVLGLACIGADGSTRLGACGSPPGLGEACGFPGACGAGTVCDADSAMCVIGKARRDGAACSTGGDCASLACLEDSAGGGVCSGPLASPIACTGAMPAAAAITPTVDGGPAETADGGVESGGADTVDGSPPLASPRQPV
jgi:hypothetical protein